MKLHYLHTGHRLRSLVMTRDAQRIELHIKPVGEEQWALVALSGPLPGQQPARSKCQGPYHRAEQAEGALRGIAGALLEQGYDAAPQTHPVWALTAQRLARAIRETRDANAGDYAFDPDQHEPLW